VVTRDVARPPAIVVVDYDPTWLQQFEVVRGSSTSTWSCHQPQWARRSVAWPRSAPRHHLYVCPEETSRS
jgi:hypothetical protein